MNLEVYRHPLASDTRHSLYRAHPERWLESIAREDITRIDAMLDQRFVYAQVLANAGGEHGVLDLLTVTRSGRLAIIELKASAHPICRCKRPIIGCVFAASCGAEKSPATDIFQASLCSRLRRSSIWWRRRCDSIRQPMTF
jgi:hypothetical protein